ncbi:MAG: hypothetical protein NT049_01330, partial [Planctomycetota bacterium]|nr:hypothetical protein [Planctomycetota bacterium]
IMMAEYEFPNEPFYYPYVVKGVCEISCGQLMKATETFNALLKHPRVDESTYSGLGYICQQQGMHCEAMEYYRKSRTCDPSDPTARAGELTNAILCGEAVDVEQALQGLNLGAIENLEDRAKIRAIRAFALGSVGRLAEAEAEFDSLIAQGWVNASILVNFATVLVKHNRRQEARDLLVRHCRQFPDRALFHLMATLSFQIGEWDKAQDQFAALVERFPLVRQYRIDAAQVFWHADNPVRAKQLSAPVLDPTVFSLPRTENDFFFDGFANWFLARYERADYDFARSRLPPEKHYARLMQRRRQ